MVTRLNHTWTRISVNEETEGNFTPVHHQSTAMTLSTFNDPISNYTETPNNSSTKMRQLDDNSSFQTGAC